MTGRLPTRFNPGILHETKYLRAQRPGGGIDRWPLEHKPLHEFGIPNGKVHENLTPKTIGDEMRTGQLQLLHPLGETVSEMMQVDVWRPVAQSITWQIRNIDPGKGRQLIGGGHHVITGEHESMHEYGGAEGHPPTLVWTRPICNGTLICSHWTFISLHAFFSADGITAAM